MEDGGIFNDAMSDSNVIFPLNEMSGYLCSLQ
jgi:hypothetical protein